MSSPKTIDVNPIPSYRDINVSLNRDEQVELNAILAKIPGVTMVTDRVRIQSYSTATVEQVREFVEEARKKVREENERRRQQELAESKSREKARIVRAINDVKVNAENHIKNVNNTILRCEKALKNADAADTRFNHLSNISIKPHADELNAESEALKKELSEIGAICDRKVVELENYAKTIDSHACIENLNFAIANSPSSILSFSHSEQNVVNSIENFSNVVEQFKILKTHLSNIEKAISENKDMQAWTPQINAVIDSCDVTNKGSITNCINGILEIKNSFIAEQRKKSITNALQDILNELEESDNQVNVGLEKVKINNKSVENACKANISEAKKLIDEIENLGYLDHRFKSNFASLKAGISSQVVFSASQEARLSNMVSELNKIANETRIDARNYQEYQKYHEVYKQIKKEFSQVDWDFGYSERPFNALNGRNSIASMKQELERLANMARLFRRNATTEQIKIDRNSSEEGKFILFEETIRGVEENNRLLFVKEGSFGMMYEYVVEPGGNAHYYPRRLKLPKGNLLIDKEEHIKMMQNDCSGIKNIADSLVQMGYAQTDITITEDEDMDGYAESGEAMEITQEQIERYVRMVSQESKQSYEEGSQEYYSQLIKNIEDGLSVADAKKRAIETIEAQRDAEIRRREERSKQTLYIKDDRKG